MTGLGRMEDLREEFVAMQPLEGKGNRLISQEECTLGTALAQSQKYRFLHGPKCYWRNYFSVSKTGWSQHPPETQQRHCAIAQGAGSCQRGPSQARVPEETIQAVPRLLLKNQ